LIFEKLNNKYQIGEEFKSKLSDQFSQKDISLIVIEDLKKLEEIIPKIIINEGDPDKKGRNILPHFKLAFWQEIRKIIFLNLIIQNSFYMHYSLREAKN
jgi:hypothetical protein